MQATKNNISPAMYCEFRPLASGRRDEVTMLNCRTTFKTENAQPL